MLNENTKAPEFTLHDKDGNSVGCAVSESMDIRKMHNGPYDKFNNFPR